MKRIVLANVIVLFVVAIVPAQSREHTCHVYVFDVERARQAFERFRMSGDPEKDAKAFADGQTVFPEFHPVIGEEELTTKTYRFPRSRLTITASVYYTDESMASVDGSDSMMVGIVVAPKAQRDAISAEKSAVAEVSMNAGLDTVRATQYVKVNGRLYLVGIECRCKERSNAK
jgi:hypothetical protein